MDILKVHKIWETATQWFVWQGKMQALPLNHVSGAIHNDLYACNSTEREIIILIKLSTTQISDILLFKRND